MQTIILTADQFRMAKAALRLSNPDLSELTGLHRNTLNKVDVGKGSTSTLKLLRMTFENAGIIFIAENGGGAGVRLAKPGIQD